jgi:hypothetical protein
MTFLTRSCKQVAALLIAREDRDLGTVDRLALHIHLKICDTCPRFQRPILTIRQGMKQWRNYSNPD